jgi:nucleoside-diphosphate-sugar epimerase
VKDVANAICYVLKHDVNGIHLLAGHEELSVCEMLKKVCEVLSPSISPIVRNGIEAKNQLIKPSLDLPKTRSFIESLIDIRESI